MDIRARQLSREAQAKWGEIASWGDLVEWHMINTPWLDQELLKILPLDYMKDAKEADARGMLSPKQKWMLTPP